MQFIFEHNTGSLLPFLQEAGRHLQAVLPVRDDNEMLLHRCNFILTELCTNGIKHSGMPYSVFDINVENNHLVIEKKEAGQPFCVVTKRKKRLLFPYDVKGCITLTEDGVNRLKVQRMNEQSVRFYTEDVLPANLLNDGGELGEHFGMIIICRSSDSFIYTLGPGGVNIFTVYIKIA